MTLVDFLIIEQVGLEFFLLSVDCRTVLFSEEHIQPVAYGSSQPSCIHAGPRSMLREP